MSGVFTIPASTPFLPTLVEALLAGRLVPGFPESDPLALASATLYLPTRRACRLARDVFLDAIESEAAILPRIVPIGDVDEDEIVFAEIASGASAAQALAIRPALPVGERKLLLAQLILKWAQTIHPEKGPPLVANNPATALTLADHLAHLIDDMITRSVPWEKLDELVPDEHDDYWQLTLRFLQIARRQWPAILDERGAIEAAERRDRLIAAEAERLKTMHDGPVIAAGSTGSMPATAALLEAIAALPRGAVVLPGLDHVLDLPSWELISGKRGADGREIAPPAPGHPQFALAALLQRMGLNREDVVTLDGRAAARRDALASEAFRPAAASELWRERLAGDFAAGIPAALDNLALVAAATAEEESLAIAVALREAVQEADATAALITPDRALARRVVAALQRWNVTVDDSGGDPLAETAAGIFARLAAETALAGSEPVTLLALLKHPLCRLGGPEFAHDEAIAALELALLRGPRPRAGTAALAHALKTFRAAHHTLHRSDPRRSISERALDAAAHLTDRLAAALAPLEEIAGARSVPLADIAERHHQAIARLSSESRGRAVAFLGVDGVALADALNELAASGAAKTFALAPVDYSAVIAGLLAGRIVRRPGDPGARVRILGLLEARLQQADRVVLGGLVEGVWPPDPTGDPWLSRPMRHTLGLDLPERRIGLSAHDFAQALGNREVILTRAAKREGAPTVASRFLQRLAAVAGEEQWKGVAERGRRYLTWARALDHCSTPKAAERPAPKPPFEARPDYLTVTEIEHWLRDPYTIYAKHVLDLRVIDPVDTPPGVRDRGTVIHNAIAEFTERFGQTLPDDMYGELIAIGLRHFAPLDDYAEAKAFWWPRFERIARWFVSSFAPIRQAQLAELHSEIRGEIAFPFGAKQLRLAARADRIERLADGHYAILDYKTGKAPTEPQVRTGLSPQLTLEAAILRAGGFPGIASGASVAELVYVEIRGGEPAGRSCDIRFKQGDPDIHAERARAKLAHIVERFADADTPYRSLVHPMWRTRYGDYDHLARVKEWALAGGEIDPGLVVPE
jgi:ATP-dependent helicase/nuclease subunit B